MNDGFTKVSVVTGAGNVLAQKFYQKQGYRPTEIRYFKDLEKC